MNQDERRAVARALADVEKALSTLGLVEPLVVVGWGYRRTLSGEVEGTFTLKAKGASA